MEDQQVTELPGLVTFECELSKPNVKVQWLKSGKPILPNKKFEVVMDGSVHRLVIRDIVNEEDIAEYTATVRGKSSKAALKINGEISVLLFCYIHFMLLELFMLLEYCPSVCSAA